MKMLIFNKIKYDFKGHWRSQKVFFVFKNLLFPKYLFCLTFNLNQIMYKWLHNKDTFFQNMMFDLKGHISLNKILFVYIFSSNNSSVKPLLSLYASLSFLSLSCSSSLFLFYQPAPPAVHPPTTNLQLQPIKKFEGELLLTVSLLPSPSLTLSLCLSIFSFSLVLLLSFSFFHPPPP